MIKFDASLEAVKRTSGLVAASSDYSCMFMTTIPHMPNSGSGTMFYARDTSDPTNKFIRIVANVGMAGSPARLEIGGATPETYFLAYQNLGTARPPNWIWYVREGTVHRVYLQGSLILTITHDISSWNLDEVYLGTNLNAGSWIAHSVGAFREWNVALTPAQLRAEINSATPVITSGLTCDTPLLTDLLDDSGNASDWAMTTGSGVFFKHAILDLTPASQDLAITVAEHNAANEVFYTLAATQTKYYGFQLPQAGDVPLLDVECISVETLPDKDAERRIKAPSGWFRTTVDKVYTFRVSDNGTGASALASDATLHIEHAPTLPATLPTNAVVIQDDTKGFPATVYKDGEFLGFAGTIPPSEMAATLPDGYSIWHDGNQQHGNKIALIAPDLSLVSAFNLPGGDAITGTSQDRWPRFATCNGEFYVLSPITGAVYTVTTAGVVTPIATVTAINTFGERFYLAIGISPDGSILYYTTGDQTGAIHRWSLATDSALSDLYTITGFTTSQDYLATTPNFNPGDVVVLSDGTVVTWWMDRTAFGYAKSTLIHVSPAGTLLLSKDYPNPESINHLAPGADASSIIAWIWENDTGFDDFSEARIVSLALTSGLPETDVLS